MVIGKVMVPMGKTLVPPKPTNGASNGRRCPHLLECCVVEDICRAPVIY